MQRISEKEINMVIEAITHEVFRLEKIAADPECSNSAARIARAEALEIVTDKLCDALENGDRRIEISYH